MDYTDRSPFVLALVENQLIDFYGYDNVNILDFSYTNTSKYNITFRLQATYGGVVQTVCLRLIRTNPNSTNDVLGLECMDNSGDIIYLNYLYSNEQYIMQAMSRVNGVLVPLDERYINFRTTEVEDAYGLQGVFIAFLLVCFGACLGLALRSLITFVLGAYTGLIVSHFVKLISLNMTSIIVMIVIAIIILVRKREPGN